MYMRLKQPLADTADPSSAAETPTLLTRSPISDAPLSVFPSVWPNGVGLSAPEAMIRKVELRNFGDFLLVSANSFVHLGEFFCSSRRIA